MPFDEITERVAPVEKKPCSIRLRGRKAGKPSCIVGLRKSLFEQTGWATGNVIVLLGQGDDAGKMRLKHTTGPGVGAIRSLKHSGSIDLGFIGAFGETPKDQVGVEARMVDGMIEITLPDWKSVPDAEAIDDEEEAAAEQDQDMAEALDAGRRAIIATAPAARPGPNPNGNNQHDRHAAKGASSAPAVERMGVTVSFEPPEIAFGGSTMALTDRQARVLAVLVSGFGGIMSIADIVKKAHLPAAGGAAQIADDYLEVDDDLKKELGLVMRCVPKLGYSLNKQ